ncbi:N-acetylneuraminate synthase [Heliorestis acidaminivorans]|uniref:N-acetylneuraminate synthase n=1 Tax=Heliorestis acidaminivorans TaxID=553427 RepID=A0A6I0ETV6_9FIRM|nr:N-acetylneuraminate synthase [Heliorestis acidaminivorans]KAB2953624.1 N-acetylneuraminate synthase [Heliorestis acidaminivorans]
MLKLGGNLKTYIIAEAGVNHNGSLEKALQLVDVAVSAGADAVKFQTFKAEKQVTYQAPKASYQMNRTDKSESQWEMLKKLELDREAYLVLKAYCHEKKIDFLSTPFDIESLQYLAFDLGVSLLKLPSGEITHGPLLLNSATTGLPIIISTGMSKIGEIEEALSILAYGYLEGKKDRKYPSLDDLEKAYLSAEGQALLREKVTLLHCTSEYPAPFNQINLKAMDTLRSAFNLSVGYSDHSTGIAVAIAAVARGATVIEKHFTLDKNMLGPDHQASLEPDELNELVKAVRQVEKAIGSSLKTITSSEIRNRDVARKSLVASQSILAGEVFTEENLTCKRPGIGISPMQYWQWLGKIAQTDYKKDDLI